MKDPYYNQCIHCQVESCKFHNKENECTLSSITVSTEHSKTICASFEKEE